MTQTRPLPDIIRENTYLLQNHGSLELTPRQRRRVRHKRNRTRRRRERPQS